MNTNTDMHSVSAVNITKPEITVVH